MNTSLKKDFLAFAQMLYALTIESLDAPDSDEVQNKHDIEVYKAIKDRVYLPLFLMEIMTQKQFFNWDRDTRIIEQSLVVLTVCFSDIYSYLTEEEQEHYEMLED